MASILANVAVLPYVLSLRASLEAKLPIPLSVAILVQMIQATVFFAAAIFLALFLGKRVGLGVPIMESWLKREATGGRLRSTLRTSTLLGVLVGISIFILDRFVFSIFVESITVHQAAPPLWQRFLASFYGGIGEEIVIRLFLMTLVVWVTYKLKRTKDNMPTNLGVWLAIVLVSIVFGLGHLPMTAAFTEVTAVVVIRAIILNGIAGIVFGWLYWKERLEASVISHFSADIVLHVILPSVF